MAPEYAMRKAITEKVDVFSFGIVLLEIISGQTNAKYEANQETEFLLDTVRRQQLESAFSSGISNCIKLYTIPFSWFTESFTSKIPGFPD